MAAEGGSSAELRVRGPAARALPTGPSRVLPGTPPKDGHCWEHCGTWLWAGEQDKALPTAEGPGAPEPLVEGG